MCITRNIQDQTFENNLFKNILKSPYQGHCAKSDLTKVGRNQILSNFT